MAFVTLSKKTPFTHEDKGCILDTKIQEVGFVSALIIMKFCVLQVT